MHLHTIVTNRVLSRAENILKDAVDHCISEAYPERNKVNLLGIVITMIVINTVDQRTMRKHIRETTETSEDADNGSDK